MRAATASLLGRLAAQPLHGPRVALLLGRLLPPGLVAALLVRASLQVGDRVDTHVPKFPVTHAAVAHSVLSASRWCFATKSAK